MRRIDRLLPQLWGDQPFPVALRRGDWWMVRRALLAFADPGVNGGGIYEQIEVEQILKRVEAAMRPDPDMARAIDADEERAEQNAKNLRGNSQWRDRRPRRSP